jgi:Na+-driven multidrug efflux pump
VKESLRVIGHLWRQFLPLSLSDVTMAAGDPAITATLTHLPDARSSLGAVGIAKSIAVFFESPIIMLLHASNAMAPAAAARKALWRFMVGAVTLLTIALVFLSLPSVFPAVGQRLMGVEPGLAETARNVLLVMALWPAAIGWRRYYQGLLIRAGHAPWVARAGIARLLLVLAVLYLGYVNEASGALLAGLALASGVVLEAAIVTVAARRTGATIPPVTEMPTPLPRNVREVWRFYWPLANSMVVVWGGRALLIALIARSVDSALALAAWPAAWSFVLVVANASRMVQQVIIRHKGELPGTLLAGFAASVGLALSLLLLLVGWTPPGQVVIGSFVGNDPELLAAVQPVVLATAVVPFLVAMQNALQGFLIGGGHTGRINAATWVGTATLLLTALAGVKAGFAGATTAAVAMVLGLFAESLTLGAKLGAAYLVERLRKRSLAPLAAQREDAV